MPDQSNAPAERPVKLQVNTSGAWKDVAFFDASDVAVTDQVTDGAAQVGEATKTPFRIATRDGLQTVLFHFIPGDGWKEAHRRG